MGISIKDPETEAIIRKLAEKLDVGLTEAVKLAGQNELDRRRQVDRWRRIEEIQAEVAKIEVVDPRPIDELMADDEPW